MRLSRPLFHSGIVVAILATPARAQRPVTVTTTPPTLTEGVFAEFAVTGPGPLRAVEGRLSGETIEFERDTARVWHGIGAVPLGSAGQVTLTLVLTDSTGARRTQELPVAVRSGTFPVDRLSVAPRFTAPPDSALAARIAAEQQRALDVSRRSRGTPRLWKGPFRRPRPSRVTSEFGRAREFNGALQSRHLGVDLAGAVGAPVTAANRGVVALVAQTYYGGNVVYVDHGAGLVTAYLHLSRTLVAQGDTVRAGTPIGRVGATGRVTGPHLHWIARFGMLTVDPLSLEALDLSWFP